MKFVALSVRCVRLALCLAFCTAAVRVSAQIDNVPSAFTEFLANRQRMLAGVTSYESEGFVSVTTSDRLMEQFRAADPTMEKVNRFRFHVWAKNACIKVQYDKITDGKEPVPDNICYLDETHISTHDIVHGNNAKMASLSKSDRYGILNLSPAFMDCSFIQKKVDIFGIHAIPPKALASNESWTAVLKGIKSALSSQLDLARNDGITTINFSNAPIPGGTLYPSRIQFSNQKSAPVATVEILEVAANAQIGFVAQKVRLNTFAPVRDTSQSDPSATWEFEFTKFLINPNIEEDNIRFDPASANSIWDADHQVRVKVPK